jgi:hypothetical protein
MSGGIGNILDGICSQFPPGDPDYDALLYWNNAENKFDYLGLGDGLVIEDGLINVEGGSGSQDLQSVTDLGATTTQTITHTADSTFTYSSGQLVNITYSDGTEKDFAYNLDGTLDTLTITYPAETPIVKTFTWSGGVLQGISVA